MCSTPNLESFRHRYTSILNYCNIWCNIFSWRSRFDLLSLNITRKRNSKSSNFNVNAWICCERCNIYIILFNCWWSDWKHSKCFNIKAFNKRRVPDDQLRCFLNSYTYNQFRNTNWFIFYNNNEGVILN